MKFMKDMSHEEEISIKNKKNYLEQFFFMPFMLLLVLHVFLALLLMRAMRSHQNHRLMVTFLSV